LGLFGPLVSCCIIAVITGCHPRHNLFSLTAALDSSGRTSVNTAAAFKMGSTGVLQPGTCTAHTLTDADSTHQFSDSIAIVLPQNGYCTYLIPEYHDDQALRANDNTTYGPVVWTFASPWVGNYTQPSDFEGSLWLNVAIVKVDPYSAALPPEYQRLHLQVGFNCMFLHHDTSESPRHWIAAMVPAAKDSDCGGLTITASDTLPVYDEHQSPDANDYPAVTRIIEASDTHSYIGVRCGNSWCVVGATFPQVPKASFDGVTNAGVSARWRVKGWFDEQHLAVVDATNRLRPQQLAALIPSDSLSLFDSTAYAKGWKLVAQVYFPDPPVGKYGQPDANGYGWTQGFNKVWLHSTVVSRPTSKDTVIWTSAFGEDAGHATHIKQVIRTDHGQDSLPVPWTARWRWAAGDEQMWVACLAGCCMVKPIDN
jgi:hypothetical protein